MKITIRYEPPVDSGWDNLLLRITLPKKFVDGPAEKVMALFADYLIKKRPEILESGKYGSTQAELIDSHYFFVKGSKRLEKTDLTGDFVRDGNEIIFVPEGEQPRWPTEVVVKAEETPKAAKTSAQEPRTDGKVQCKRFGCNQWFDPNDNDDENACVYHESAPIFHETAKWWSCCPSKKAYDWDEFPAIPGCRRGKHSTENTQKKFLGGSDLRDQMTCAPKKLSEAGPITDPRKKLEAFKKGLEVLGGDCGNFEKAWGRLAAKHGNFDKVVDHIRGSVDEAICKCISDCDKVKAAGS